MLSAVQCDLGGRLVRDRGQGVRDVLHGCQATSPHLAAMYAARAGHSGRVVASPAMMPSGQRIAAACAATRADERAWS